MRSLTWNSHWLWPGASLWCLASKVAFVSTVEISDVLRLLAGATPEYRLPIWMAGAAARQTVARYFGLTPGGVEALFHGNLPCTLEEREHLSLSLRWCPACLGDWYHSVGFQDRRVLRCPWHGTLLRESCPKCGRLVDPLGPAWACSFCRSPLTSPPRDWLRDFKRGPGHSGRWPSELPLTHIAYADEEGRVLCYDNQEALALFEGHPRAIEYWQQGQLFESACALWDTVLHDHRPCAYAEPHAYAPQYAAQGFVCPVAGAAFSAFGSLNLACEIGRRWPQEPLPGAAHPYLPWPTEVPFEVLRALLRELPRAWLVDALLVFGDAAKSGHVKARWEVREGVFSAVVESDVGLNGVKGLRAIQKTQMVTLKAARDYAAESCQAEI